MIFSFRDNNYINCVNLTRDHGTRTIALRKISPQKIAPDLNPNPNPNLKPGGEIVGEQSSGGQFSGHQRSHVNF